MKIAFVVFNELTSLDFIGIYDPITRLKNMGFLPELSWDICAYTSKVQDDKGLQFLPSKIAQPLVGYDILIVPGGYGTRTLQHDDAFINWLKTADKTPLKISICTGSLLFGAAGFLKQHIVTTHPNAIDELKVYSSNVVSRRIVDANDVISSGGVSAAIDLGLYLCEKLAGKEARIAIAKQMDYPY